MTRHSENISDIIVLGQACAFVTFNGRGVTPKELQGFMSHSGYKVSLYKVRKALSSLGKSNVMRYDHVTKLWKPAKHSRLMQDIAQAFGFSVKVVGQ